MLQTTVSIYYRIVTEAQTSIANTDRTWNNPEEWFGSAAEVTIWICVFIDLCEALGCKTLEK